MKPNRPKPPRYLRLLCALRVHLRYLCAFVLLFSACSIKYTIPDYNYIADTDLKPIVLSEKVGDTIDTLERQQYELFPKAVDFASAQVFEIIDSIGGYYVEVNTNTGKMFRSVVCDPKGLWVLRSYIVDFDMYRLLDTKLREYGGHSHPMLMIPFKQLFEKNYRIVDYDDALGLPITQEEAALFNRTKVNTKMYGGCCCLASCMLGGAFWTINVGMDADPGSSDNTPITIGAIVGVLAGSFGGYITGNVMDKRETIKAIKEGRQLRPFK